MKKTLQKLLSTICIFATLITSSSAVSVADFPDAANHWAHDALDRAASSQLILGDGNALHPDKGLTVAQMTAILNRVLSADNADRTYPGVVSGQWYSDDANKGVSLGILPSDGSLNVTAPATRGQVFQALTAAFGLDEANVDERILTQFNDLSGLTPAQRRSAAVLVRDGIVSGTKNGTLDATRGVTRAEFISLIYRIWNNTYLSIIPFHDTTKLPEITPEISRSDAEPEPNQTEALQNSSSEQEQEDNATPSKDINLTEDQPTDQSNQTSPKIDTLPESSAYLLRTQPEESFFPHDRLYDRVILRGNNMTSVFEEGNPISIRRFVIGTTGSDFLLTNDNKNNFETVVIAGGTGDVTLSGELTRNAEITGSGRTIHLNGVYLDNLTITGTNNIISVDSFSFIKSLTVSSGASNNRINLEGNLSDATLIGAYTTLGGRGEADYVTITGKHNTVNIVSTNINDQSDNGLDGVKLSITAPTVAPGGSINATVTMTGVEIPKNTTAQWYLNDSADAGFVNSSFLIEDGKLSTYKRALNFERNMVLDHKVGFRLTYFNPSSQETETVYAETSVKVENYPSSHYLPDASEVLAKVHPTYKKGNTDYSQEEKTVFVNAKGYSSPTKYMIWISRSAQMVNIFEGSKNNWKLIHEFECGTGAPGMDTPVGVTYVTYKQTNWTTENYTCRPIVRFYPGTGYAFHSRLYYPGTNRLLDARIGFPLSHGCVRMMDEGINWIYNNVPTKTTVVIY